MNQLAFPTLTEQRTRIANALTALGTGDDAAQTLGLGSKSQADLALNAALWENPCAPMEHVFSGVLYAAAQLADINEASCALLRERLTIFSGLFGVLRLGDLIPDHRLSMGVKLPDIGALAAAWKPYLEEALHADYNGEVVLDMRSGPYRSACPAQWANVWQVGVVRETNGKRVVVSHNAKYWRGLVTGYFLRLPEQDYPTADTSVDEICDLLSSAVSLPAMRDAKGVEHRIIDVEFSDIKTHKAGGSSRTITLITT